MNITVKDLSGGQKELAIELSTEEMKPYIDQAVADISKQTSLAGFRPGKAPFDVVEKQVGTMRIMQSAAEKAVQKTYPQAVVEYKLLTVGPPDISLQKIAPNNPFVYTATVALVPEVKLGDYKSISVAKKKPTVSDQEVTDTISNIQKMFGKEKKVLRPAKQGDKIDLDMNAYKDNVPLEGGTAKGQSVTIGEKHFIPGFEEQLLGTEPGQQKEFTLTFPKEYHRNDLANQEVEFKVKVNNVFEIEKPPLDDAFAKQAGKFTNMNDLRDQVGKNIKLEKEQKEQQRWELEIVDKIITASEFGPIPEVLKQSELDKMMRELEYDVTQQGMKFEDYLQSIKKAKDDLRKELEPKAIKRIQTALLLREIADKENITVDDAEIEKEITEQQEQYKENKEVLDKINSDEYREYLRNMKRGRKVFAFLEKTSQP